ncbi:ISL3 family transposase ISMno30 [Methylobacterium soli]|nr:ISL3 family transposase [Methylobacterium soli]GJE45645.1 ISL3 family transposase ISMno30 [Methylobacterium soli]
MAKLYEVPGCRLLSVENGPEAGVVMRVRGRRCEGRCPACGTPSTAGHGHYQRHPADLPSLGRAVRLDLAVRRLRCLNPSCSRRTFCLPVSTLLAPHARRTRRLANAQQCVGLATNARAGARLLAGLAMPASGSTLLRLTHAAPLPGVARPRAIGVDDWAWRRGRAWGTLVVDLDRHRAIDLLPDRSSATFEAWLRSHTDLEIVARDRSTGYARAAQAVVPRAQQVADRWHLLLNARQMLERWLVGAHARLRALPVPTGSAAPVRDHAFPRSRTDQAAAREAQRWRAVRHAEVQRRRAAGESIMAIARAIPLAPGTVRRYASMDGAPEGGQRRIGPSQLDPWLSHLERRRAEGCENGLQLLRELRELGYAGGSRQIHKWLQSRRTKLAITTPRRWRDAVPVVTGPGSTGLPARRARLPGSKVLAWIMTLAPDRLSPTDGALLARIVQDPDTATLHGLVQRFVALVREAGTKGNGSSAHGIRRLEAFEAWIVEAKASGIRAAQTFASGLVVDAAAVRTALTTPWSNAQAEGQITKLKSIKRLMYGRAGFDLLRRRLLLAP